MAMLVAQGFEARKHKVNIAHRAQSVHRPQQTDHVLHNDDLWLVPLAIAETAMQGGTAARCRIARIHILQGSWIHVL